VNYREYKQVNNRTLTEDYLEGAANSTAGADGFALCAPIAFNRLYDVYHIINHNQAMLPAYTYTQPAAIALVYIYLWFHCFSTSFFIFILISFLPTCL
jgi:hypothetical protein